MAAEVIDLFCGVGGLTKGLSNVGLNVIAGFDNDVTCRYAYTQNNTAEFHLADIRNISGNDLKNLYDVDSIKILVGCAPCQPFSQLRSKFGKKNMLDEKYTLLNEFGRLIRQTYPSIISMENVPQLQKTKVYSDFIHLIDNMGYSYDAKIINCADYGISQGRRRFVLVGSLLGNIKLISPTHREHPAMVKDFIKNLPCISAGEIDEEDPLHQSAQLSETNMKRIQYSKPGGTWRDWPEELLCKCHKKQSGKTYSSVYGRTSWDQVGPTITTQFYSYGTGRFGHPEQNRALSLREGALLQTFPPNYDFIDPDVAFSFKNIARHIGNAVPVKLGEVIGQSIYNHLRQYGY